MISIAESKRDITTKLNTDDLSYVEIDADDEHKGKYDSYYGISASLQVYFLDDKCVRIRLGSGYSDAMIPQTVSGLHQGSTYSQMLEQYGVDFETHTYAGKEIYKIYRYSVDDCIYEYGIFRENSDSIYNIDIYVPDQSPIYDYGEEIP